MRRVNLGAIVALGICAHLRAHDVSTTPITWNREISRIFYERCISCHRPEGTSFSLVTYPAVQPRAVEIRDAVLSRRMPPWGAVKGFGHFRNDQGLTQEQIALVADWVEGGISKGNNPNALPAPPKFEKLPRFEAPANAIGVSGDLRLDRAVALDGVDRKSTRLNSSHMVQSRMPSSA